MLRRHPSVLLLAAAALLLVATRQAYTVRFTGLGLSPAQLILFVLAALWVLTRVVGQRAPAGLGLLAGLPLVLFGATLLSYGVSHEGALTADQLMNSDRAILLTGLAVATVVVVPTLLRTRADLEFVLRGLVIGGVLSGLFALIAFATGLDIAGALHVPGLRDTGGVSVVLLREGLERPQGAAATPLELGGVLTILAPIGLGLFFAARRRGERAWPWALAVVVLVGGGAVSLSRSVFLGLAVAALVMVPRWPVRRAAAAAAGTVAVVAVAAVVASGLVSTLVSLLQNGSQDYSLESRADGRSYVWAHFADHFWLGQGPGTYDLNRQQVLDNQYLSQLMEGGVIGALLLLAVLVCAFGYAIRAARVGAGRDDTVELANGLAGALAAALAVNAVLDTSGFVQIFTLIWLVIALTAAVWRLTVADRRAAPTPELTPAAVAAR